MWQPFKNLTFGRHQDAYESDKIVERLYQDEYDRSDLQYQLGWGQLNAYQERRRIGGTLANPLYQDSEFWRFQSSAVRNLNLALEERRTTATGAPSERYRHYQTAYTLNPRTKLQLAHMEANREGASDESAQQIGLEYELKPGAKLTFSETRQAKEGANGNRVLSAGLTQTAFGVLSIGGVYQEQRIDRTNTRAQSQVVVQSAKPFSFLGLQEFQSDFRYGALAIAGCGIRRTSTSRRKPSHCATNSRAAMSGCMCRGRGALWIATISSDRRPIRCSPTACCIRRAPIRTAGCSWCATTTSPTSWTGG